MTPVNQSKLYQPDGIHNGNCLAACLASLLDIPLWMVPPFDQMFGREDWRERIDDWLKRMFQKQRIRTEGHEILNSEKRPEYYIANGPATCGVCHSVIYRHGQLAHDPHPAKSGLLSVEWTWHLEPVAGSGHHQITGKWSTESRTRAMTKLFFDEVIDPLRACARELGYAITVHGSLARDIDLVAIPWTWTAAPAKELAEAVRLKAEEVMAIAFMNPVEAEDEFHQNGCPRMKAHGRLVWSYHLGGGPYIDLSVMPITENIVNHADTDTQE